MPDPRNYTVGWICAIPTEFAAARAFLDEQHPDPEAIAQNDNNTYALGTMGRHNVVIAVMPKKEYGIAAAATVARDMVHSFPNVRIGLMVGVGGGAPSKQNDIRLGDVVVGSRGAGNGGVIQYDYGKSIQNQAFVETGVFNQPPPVLLNAVAGLETDHMMEGSELPSKVERALSQWKRLRKTHSRPSASTDQLYRSDFAHPPGSSAACSQECSANISNVVSRDERGEDEDNPAIHYGLVASANQVMKNAETRDNLSRERGVLCFEMEAAGLMNHFPCLVVRGICDYSDSHKNMEWQGFAAMTAAAYAKDIICRILPNQLEAERKIKEVLESMKESLASIELTTVEMKTQIDRMSSNSHVQKIKEWLSPPDTSTNYNLARERRHKGTGLWFLKTSAYQEWEHGSRKHLWIHGMPGCGKTVLVTTILHHLARMKDLVTLEFFFDFSDTTKQKTEDMCRPIAFQLYNKRIESRKELDSLLASHDDGRRQPTPQALTQCLQAMMHAGDGYKASFLAPSFPTSSLSRPVGQKKNLCAAFAVGLTTVASNLM
ncbi:ankyrin repeat protein [Colletotrichum caudatum]|nr:ankyrin repeat protein [Colletotrichum caudatum]